MFPRFLAALTLAWLALLAGGAAAEEVAVPPLQARVTDLAGMLSPQQQATLEQSLTAFEARKGSQIAVLIVPTTQPEAIEQYALRVAEQWKLGRKGVDDGVLLLIASNDRALRIEVGYGLEGPIPDAVAKRIISEVITPFFKQGDYYGGIEAGVHRIMRLIEGEALPPPSRKDVSWASLEEWLPAVLIVVFVAGGVLRALLGRLAGAVVAGSVATVLFWLLVSSLLGALAVGLVAFLLTLMGGSRIMGRGGFGGWHGGGGFGGGGFSGGGGGFGGGGASGRW